jgi:ribosomal protein L37AE/L43A
MPCMPPPKRCKHSKSRLVTEGVDYEIWQCIRCDHRQARGSAQLSLFSRGQAQLGALQEEFPIPA